MAELLRGRARQAGRIRNGQRLCSSTVNTDTPEEHEETRRQYVRFVQRCGPHGKHRRDYLEIIRAGLSEWDRKLCDELWAELDAELARIPPEAALLRPEPVR